MEYYKRRDKRILKIVLIGAFGLVFIWAGLFVLRDFQLSPVFSGIIIYSIFLLIMYFLYPRLQKEYFENQQLKFREGMLLYLNENNKDQVNYEKRRFRELMAEYEAEKEANKKP